MTKGDVVVLSRSLIEFQSIELIGGVQLSVVPRGRLIPIDLARHLRLMRLDFADKFMDTSFKSRMARKISITSKEGRTA
jgi:hypothetical protein